MLRLDIPGLHAVGAGEARSARTPVKDEGTEDGPYPAKFRL